MFLGVFSQSGSTGTTLFFEKLTSGKSGSCGPPGVVLPGRTLIYVNDWRAGHSPSPWLARGGRVRQSSSEGCGTGGDRKSNHGARFRYSPIASRSGAIAPAKRARLINPSARKKPRDGEKPWSRMASSARHISKIHSSHEPARVHRARATGRSSARRNAFARS